MQKQELIYEGKGKKIFATTDPQLLIAEFKDDLTAFNAQKKGSEDGKGALNAEISSKLFGLLEQHGIKTHLKQVLDEKTHLIQKVQIIPLEVIARNVATGSLTKKFGIKEGTILENTLVEFCLKDDDLGDPLLCSEHIFAFKLATKDELETIKQTTKKINSILLDFFGKLNLRLIDFKIEFGRTQSGEILLADEISPDSCRFWDATSGEKLDKDRFRQGIGDVKTAYADVLERIKKGLK